MIHQPMDSRVLNPYFQWSSSLPWLPIATITCWNLPLPNINFKHSAPSASLSAVLLTHSRNPPSQFFSPEVPTIHWLYPLIHLCFMDSNHSLIHSLREYDALLLSFHTHLAKLKPWKSNYPLISCLQPNNKHSWRKNYTPLLTKF